ncbi:MAG: sulfur carrier protein ThiS adenylyltransferase ThiF [Candidatus Zapsychrus exili]|nr:sulfur carrier protein ThiS adenylyltransferase ThiF [Candidatus Zapsychrus exili]
MNQFHEGLLKYLTQEQFDKIQSVNIGIGGAGGLGSNVAIILVRSGFKNIEILDLDTIEPSNLNRQQYFINEIGQNKIDTLKNRLLKINPDLNIKAHHVKWSKNNGENFFKNCEFIIEAFDKTEYKHEFVEYYQDKAPTIITGNGMAGISNEHPILVKKLDNIYFVGDNKTDTNDGHPPMSPRVTMCASMMAEVVLKQTLIN